MKMGKRSSNPSTPTKSASNSPSKRATKKSNTNSHTKEDEEAIYFDDDVSYEIIDAKPSRQQSTNSASISHSPIVKQIANKIETGENDDDDDEEIFNLLDVRSYSLDEKLNDNSKYQAKFVKFLDAKEFNYKYMAKNGFIHPIVFREKTGLGMRVPSENFKVTDVKSCVGSKRQIDVMDSNTQKGFTMSMKDWCEYYENPVKRENRLLNVISLEFSHTKLENYVEAPLVVRQLDWIETAWPQHLRQQQSESTNIISKMQYPKVQKYVLMSVKDCYTDFHIDMGGTSVWYHILKGEKIFWLIPPTEANLNKYVKWTKSGQQAHQFFADMSPDECERIVLKQGQTFMLPSGWIHAVYTSQDSLVFGGNFLHSFNIQMQLKIYEIENKTKVPQQYRYPFFIEMLWFVLDRYVHCLTGITHVNTSETYLSRAYKTFEPTNLNLNKYELDGLNCLYKFFVETKLYQKQSSVPAQLVQPEELINSIKLILDNYTNKKSETNSSNDDIPFIHWPKAEKKYLKKISASYNREESSKNNSQNGVNGGLMQSKLSELIMSDNLNDNSQNNVKYLLQSQQPQCQQQQQQQQQSRKHNMRNLPRTKGSIKKRLRPQNVPRSNVERRRRVRCHKCEPCTRDDCGECKYCKDMKKFGGTGISKQCCLSKQCLQPLLPTTTTCMLCEQLIDRSNPNMDNLMFECEICFEIYHAHCFRKQYSNLNEIEPLINEDLYNCWTCANCVFKGYTKPCDSQNNSNNNNSGNQSHSNNTSLNTNKDENSQHSCSFNNSLNTSFNSSFLMNETNNKNNNYNNNNNDAFNKIENIDLKMAKKKEKRPRQPKYKRYDNEYEIRLDELNDYEKDVIMREFCELVYLDHNETNKSNNSMNNYNYVENDDDDDDLDLASIKVLRDEDSHVINPPLKSDKNGNNDEYEDEFFYMDDDNIEYEIPSSAHTTTNMSFDSVMVNNTNTTNNDTTSSPNSFLSSCSNSNSTKNSYFYNQESTAK